jgi:uncharacterized membrane protein YdbT with pleckstrin-like domain
MDGVKVLGGRVMDRETVWKSRPSQIPNIPYFIVFSWTIILPLYRYLQTRFTSYGFSEDRMIIKKGILSQSIDEIELYRVRDYSVSKPFLLRIFGLGHLQILSSDRSTPNLTMRAIHHPESVMDKLRDCVEGARARTQTKEVDFS